MTTADPGITEPKPFEFFPVTVAAVQEVTPGFRRITFRGPSLRQFGDPGWDQRIKLIFTVPGADLDALIADPDWYTAWRELPDPLRPPIRTYTTRAVRAESEEVDVDMVVHTPAPGETVGPASQWIATAAVGDPMLLLGPNALANEDPGGVDFVPPAQTDRFLIAGDATAAPAIAVILEQLPRDARGIAVVEVDTAADAAYLPAHPGIEVRPAVRDGRPYGVAFVEATTAAAEALTPPGIPHEVTEIDVDSDLLWEVPRHAKGGAALERTSLYAWLAGEASAVKTLRRTLVGERGLDRRTVAFMGYWRQGRAEN